MIAFQSPAFLLRLAGAVTFALLALAARGAAPFLEKIDLFEGDRGGYKTYRIPGSIVTAHGVVLATCEARRTGNGDWDTIDIMLRRSVDGGRTWDPPRKIADVKGPKTKNPVSLKVPRVDPKDVTYDNAVMIADRDDSVHVVFCLEYCRSFHMRSDDDGLTFSTPVEITPTLLPDGTVLCFYERRGVPSSPREVRRLMSVARFNLEWLTDGRDSPAAMVAH
jgi:sialidase-1